MDRRDYIGRRVARWRDTAGMTQQQLADRVGVTTAYISMIERGKRPITKMSLLIGLATALRVSTNDLTGQPELPKSSDDLAIYYAVPDLRGALDDESETDNPIDVDQVTANVDRAMGARMACDYQTVAALLPGLIRDTRQLANAGHPAGRPLFVRAATCAALAIKPFGYLDLAARISERANLAADTLGAPVEQGAARFVAAQTALSSGTAGGRRRALGVATQAAEQLGDSGADDSLTWYVMLHLTAALASASMDRGDTALDHLAEADATAGRITSDPWRMEPTQANVAVWKVGVALENGEPEMAPVYARRVDRSQLRTVQRRARLHIDAGRGCYTAGDSAGCVQHFLEADEVSQTELRSRPSVRDLVRQMVHDAARAGSPELRELAVRVGIDPLDA